jgi:metallo-beta-lactamase family protein
MGAMSGHADREELFRWMSGFKNKPKITFCVHGEGDRLMAYAQAIRDRLKWNVSVPEYLESVVLFSGI